MPVYLLLPVAISVVCLLGWIAWLSFNWRVFRATKDLDAFDHTAQLAPAFLRWFRSPNSTGDGTTSTLPDAGATQRRAKLMQRPQAQAAQARGGAGLPARVAMMGTALGLSSIGRRARGQVRVASSKVVNGETASAT